MSATLQRVAEGHWRLTGRLDFETVLDLRPRMRDAFAQGTEVEVDLGGLTHTNSAGVALLIQWLEDASKVGARLRITNPPAALIELAGLSNARQLLAI